MKLATYRTGWDGPRLGVIENTTVVDASAAHWAYLKAVGDDCMSEALIDALVPSDLLSFLRGGRRSRAALDVALDWFRAQEGSRVSGPWGRPVSIPIEEAELMAPIASPPKILCVGLNYRDHAEEQGVRLPRNPILFAKYSTSVVGPGAPVFHPKNTGQLDFEAELAVIIGRDGRHIPVEDALDHIAGYTCFNDITARDIQLGDRQWLRGKMGDSHAPMGPWLVTPDEVGKLTDLAISLQVNGHTMQNSNLGELIFDVPFLISFISETVTLQVGDVIATGTPSGVGFVRQPPVFLTPGDVVEMTIEKIGSLRNPIVAE